ncbi:unnamed protein product, partial [Trichogramma brassicae]
MPCIATYHRWAAFEFLRPETAKGYNEQDTCPRVQSSSTRGKFQSVGDEEQEETDEEDALVQARPDCSIEIPKYRKFGSEQFFIAPGVRRNARAIKHKLVENYGLRAGARRCASLRINIIITVVKHRKLQGTRARLAHTRTTPSVNQSEADNSSHPALFIARGATPWPGLHPRDATRYHSRYILTRILAAIYVKSESPAGGKLLSTWSRESVESITLSCAAESFHASAGEAAAHISAATVTADI